jgi:hypothetical protein
MQASQAIGRRLGRLPPEKRLDVSSNRALVPAAGRS